jgi:hypothetical protein
LVVEVAGGGKTYDGTTTAPVSLTDNRVGNDDLTVALNAQFSDKHAGSAKTITLTGGPLTGADAGNYGTVSYVWKDHDDKADIAQRALPLRATGTDKDYDGETTATVSFAFGDNPAINDDGLVLNDDVTVTYATCLPTRMPAPTRPLLSLASR